MKKKTFIKFLETAKSLLDGRDFNEDLNRKEKRKIFDAFMDTHARFEYDNDDWTVIFTDVGNLRVSFTSNCGYAKAEAIRKRIDEMHIEVDGYDASIDDAINYLKTTTDIMPLAILNTSILTAPGEYTLGDITLESAKKLVSRKDIDSAVGHQSTAEIMTTLLGEEIPVNRQMFEQQPGQKALVFKLNGRPQEGKILTAEEIEQIGYKFQLLERVR